MRVRALTATSHHLIWISILTVLGAAIRLISLGSKSLWFDEIISINIASHSLEEILRTRLRIGATDDAVDHLYTNNPPIHLIILHVTQLFTHSEFFLRLPFALAGIATIPVTYVVVTRLFNPAIALACTVLLTISPIHVAYSQEARPTSFLVLLSLLSLNTLLVAVENGRTRDWASFVVLCVLNIWTSYFALVLVMPTLCAIAALLLISSWRANDRSGCRNLLTGFTISGLIVGISAIPLVPDILATSEMNDAAVGTGGSLVTLWFSVIRVAWLSSPIPGSPILALLITSMLFASAIGIIRSRNTKGAIAVIWTIMPMIVLFVVNSNHDLSLRYILFALPIAVAVALNGLFSFSRFLRRRIPQIRILTSQELLFGSIIVLSIIGLAAPAPIAAAGPKKPDWAAIVRDYAAVATPESCLIVIDGRAHATNNVIPYYLEQLDTSACAIDARDPAFLEIVRTHSDLWWGIGTQFYPDGEVTTLQSQMAQGAAVVSYDLALLVHPTVDGGLHQPTQFLQEAITIMEPVGSTVDVDHPSFRQSLANLILLDCGIAAPPETITSLLDGYYPNERADIHLTWDRAEKRLARGDFEGASELGIRMIAISPGNPEIYRFLAEIEIASGRSNGEPYLWAATVLTGDAPPAETLSFAGCS